MAQFAPLRAIMGHLAVVPLDGASKVRFHAKLANDALPRELADRSRRQPGEALVDLRRRLALLSPRDPIGRDVITRAAEAYGVSVWTIYRALHESTRPRSVRRSDHNSTRAMPAAGMERYAEIVIAKR